MMEHADPQQMFNLSAVSNSNCLSSWTRQL